MATFYPSITDKQAELIKNAPLFFIATADPHLTKGPEGNGAVNLSPRGGVPLHIIDRNRVAFLDFEGSGNETARHSTTGGPITVMVCSFEEADPAIIRLFGKARVTPLAGSKLADRLLQDISPEARASARQVIEVAIEKTMTSCGFGVPVMSFVRQRRDSDCHGDRYQ